MACGLGRALLLGIWLAGLGQVEPARSPRTGLAALSASREVVVDHLEVYDRADVKSYRMGALDRGERIRARGMIEGGWLAIDPPPMAIGWVERQVLDLVEESVASAHEIDAAGSRARLPGRARAIAATMVRSGQLQAKLPGPPWALLRRGALVQLVDRPPLRVGQGAAATLWFAIVPPDDAVCHVRSEGTVEVTPTRPPVSERLAAYLADEGPRGSVGNAPIDALPADVAAEIRRLDTMHRAMLASQPIEHWRFGPIRAGYLALLKRAGDSHAVEAALRDRLARLTRHEQAARAARTIQATLAESRRRDIQVDRLRRRLAASDRATSRTYSAVGFVQPSSHIVDGRKLHVLIGSNGATLAYLDIPPGIDVPSLGARRVGVFGAAHYSQDLGARLITVRDMEAIEAKR